MAYDEDLANRIRELLGHEGGVERKHMFGGLAFLINGNMSVTASGRKAACWCACRPTTPTSCWTATSAPW